jgi:hypothetical protein
MDSFSLKLIGIPRKVSLPIPDTRLDSQGTTVIYTWHRRMIHLGSCAVGEVLLVRGEIHGSLSPWNREPLLTESVGGFWRGYRWVTLGRRSETLDWS